MKLLSAFFLVLLLSTSLALAATVTLDKQDYAKGDLATVSITCAGDWLGRVLSPDSQLVHIDQGRDSKSFTYNTLSSSATGKYSVAVSCQDGSSITKNFCVDAPGCAAVAPVGVGEQPASDSGAGQGAELNTGVGSTGRGCIPQWSCGQWGYCNATLQQGRTCTDISACGRTPRIENTSCLACAQSWICSLWSECNSGQQIRSCADEHFCGVATQKPALQKSCSDAFPAGPQPSQIVNLPPDAFSQQYNTPPVIQQPQSIIAKLWKEYRSWIIGGGVFLILAIVAVILVLVLHKSKGRAYNFDELKDWIQKERELGTSGGDIRQILAQQTGWREDEIKQAFKELQ